MVYFEGLFCNFVPKTFGNTVAAARRVYNFWNENPKDFNEFSLQTISKDFERYPRASKDAKQNKTTYPRAIYHTVVFERHKCPNRRLKKGGEQFNSG